MNPEQLLTHIAIGGIMGMIGQSLRVVAGLKKLTETSTGPGLGDQFSGSSLVVSLIIGFVAGVIALIASSGVAQVTFDVKYLLGLMTAGYAGTDFIEAFMKRYLPGRDAAATVPTPGSATASPGPVEDAPPVG